MTYCWRSVQSHDLDPESCGCHVIFSLVMQLSCDFLGQLHVHTSIEWLTVFLLFRNDCMQLMKNCSNDTLYSPGEICDALSPLHLQENCIPLASLTGMTTPTHDVRPRPRIILLPVLLL